MSFAVDPQRRQGRRGALALLVDELHPAQKGRGELVQPGVPLSRLLEAGLPVAPRPVRQIGLVLVQLRLRNGRQQSGPQLVVADVGIEQYGAEPAVALIAYTVPYRLSDEEAHLYTRARGVQPRPRRSPTPSGRAGDGRFRADDPVAPARLVARGELPVVVAAA